jgi:hypothetical protein
MIKPPAQVLQKMQDLFSREIAKLSPRIIVPTATGVMAFGCYNIDPRNGQCRVTKSNGGQWMFASQSHAMAWCIADKFAQPTTRRRIEYLSDQYYKLSTDLASFRAKYRRLQDLSEMAILEARISQCIYALTNVSTQLEKCISQTKYWQQQEFHHEIERSQATHRPTSSSSSNGELSGAWSRIQ